MLQLESLERLLLSTLPRKVDMKLKYYKEDDLMVITFSDKPADDSVDADNLILEIDKDKKPVSLEILNASKFMKAQSKALPNEIKKSIFQVV